MDLGIKGQIALVTAASRGLGRGCAEQLAAEKCRVAICSRDETPATIETGGLKTCFVKKGPQPNGSFWKVFI